MFFQRHSTQFFRLLAVVLFLVLTSHQITAQRIIYPSSFLAETYSDSTAIYVDGKIEQISADGAGVYYQVKGKQLRVSFDPTIKLPIIIRDSVGQAYFAFPNGTVFTSTYFVHSNDYLDVTAEETVTFIQHENETFGFDGFAHYQWHEQYEIIQLSDSSNYFVANKSLGVNTEDVVKVEVPEVTGAVTFKLGNGQIANT